MGIIRLIRRLLGMKDRFRLPLRRNELFDKYAVTVAVPQGATFFYQIGEKEQPKKQSPRQYTWAFVEHSRENDAAFLWFICTPEGDRRKGYGRDMIRLLQDRYRHIETHYSDDTVNSPGVRLCMACGFKPVRSLLKRLPHRLVWDKVKE